MAVALDLGALASLIFFSALYAPIYVAISLGFNILFSSTRIINIAYGDLVMIGAYMAYWLYTLYSIPPMASVLVAIALGSSIGFLLYITIFRRILRLRSIPAIEEQSIISTFGLSMAIQGVAAYIWSPAAVSYTYLDVGIRFSGLLVPINLLVIMAVGVILAIAIYVLLYRSYLGIALRGAIQSPQLAEDIGLDIDRVYMIATVIAVSLPIAVGAVISMRAQISPFMGVEYLVIALIVTALGGLGNPLGSLFGALLYSIMDSLVSYILPPGLKLFYLYMLFLAVLLARPTGIMGKTYVVR